MNTSVDYNIELNLRNLEDELKSAEQQYLEKIQCIVSKYTSRASSLREHSLKSYEEEFTSQSPKIAASKETQTPSKPPLGNIKRQTTAAAANRRVVSNKSESIEIASPRKSSGYTPKLS